MATIYLPDELAKALREKHRDRFGAEAAKDVPAYRTIRQELGLSVE